jgi:hypothetical protein
VHLHQKVPHKNRPLKSAARAAAIHECSVSAAKYLDYSWGNTEMYVYRTCMAGHRQQRE